MPYRLQAKDWIDTIVNLAARHHKLTGFTIGNTAKTDQYGLYFTPLRRTSLMISAGVIVYSEEQAVEIAKIADGRVNYILVDSEKKIPNTRDSAELANVEALVRRNVHKSTLWFYKGNDLSVDAVDGLLAQLTKRDLRGLGGRKVAILGAGNIGFKLALRMVERGAHVIITRRSADILEHLVRAINYVKPVYTQSTVQGMTDNDAAAEGAEILIGTSSGVALITPAMIERLAPNATIIDVGKGVIFPEAVEAARVRNIRIYRLDITAAFEGLVHHLWAVEDLVENKLGRRQWNGESIISGGFLGAAQEIVVDNVYAPAIIYGIADGKGDFFCKLTDKQKHRLQRLREMIDRGQS